jgi:hypothetical protein
MYSFIFRFFEIANGQSSSEFAPGEAERLYTFLDGLGCIGNLNCTGLGTFTTTTACNYNTNSLGCNDAGLVQFM